MTSKDTQRMQKTSEQHRTIPAVWHGGAGAMSISVHVPTPTPRHLDDLLRLDCYPDLIQTGWYPNTKELTESAAAFNAARKLGLSFMDPTAMLVAVGDGRYPRTAGMFAFRTRWQCWAVDPQLRDTDWPGIRRLSGLRKRIEDVRVLSHAAYCAGPLVIACVHSHAPANAVMDFASRALGAGLATEVHVISIRCCVDDALADIPPDLEYHDWGCWSPERRVRVWRDLFGQRPPREAAA